MSINNSALQITDPARGWYESTSELKKIKIENLWRGDFLSWTQFIKSLAKQGGLNQQTLFNRLSAHNYVETLRKEIDLDLSQLPVSRVLTLSRLTNRMPLVTSFLYDQDSQERFTTTELNIIKSHTQGEWEENATYLALKSACVLVKAMRSIDINQPFRKAGKLQLNKDISFDGVAITEEKSPQVHGIKILKTGTGNLSQESVEKHSQYVHFLWLVSTYPLDTANVIVHEEQSGRVASKPERNKTPKKLLSTKKLLLEVHS